MSQTAEQQRQRRIEWNNGNWKVYAYLDGAYHFQRYVDNDDVVKCEKCEGLYVLGDGFEEDCDQHY